MDKAVNFIQALSTTEHDLKQLVNALAKEEKTFGRDVGRVDNAVDKLDAQTFSLGVSYLLAYKTLLEFTDYNHFIRQATNLLTQANPQQIAIAPQYFVGVCAKLSQACLLAGRPVAGLPALRSAINVLQAGNQQMLTNVHYLFIHLCIRAKLYQFAQEVLDNSVLEIRDMASHEYLLYFYYGGIAYLGLKKFSKAVEFFQLVLTCPSAAVSAIQLKAYQKLMLANLIANGEKAELPPKITSALVSRTLERVCFVYLEFVTAFGRGLQHAQTFLELNHEEFRRSGNLGLAKQCLNALVRRQIQRLTNTYVSLPLADIAETVSLSPAQAEKHVLRMIEDGQIHARINQKDAVVSFQEDPERFDTTTMAQELHRRVREAAILTNRIKHVDTTIQLSEQYIVKNLKQKAMRGPTDEPQGLAGPGGDSDLERALRASLHQM